MNAEIIDRPISGNYEEHHFGKPNPDGQWVKFVDKDFQEWVGSFEKGWVDKSFILEIKRSGSILVLAAGHAYLIDPNSRKQLLQTEVRGVKSAIIHQSEEVIYYSNGYEIFYFDHHGEQQFFYSNYELDALELIEIENNNLRAKGRHYKLKDEPFYLEIDLQNNELKDSILSEPNRLQPTEIRGSSLFTKLKKWLLNT